MQFFGEQIIIKKEYIGPGKCEFNSEYLGLTCNCEFNGEYLNLTCKCERRVSCLTCEFNGEHLDLTCKCERRVS